MCPHRKSIPTQRPACWRTPTSLVSTRSRPTATSLPQKGPTSRSRPVPVAKAAWTSIRTTCPSNCPVGVANGGPGTLAIRAAHLWLRLSEEAGEATTSTREVTAFSPGTALTRSRLRNSAIAGERGAIERGSTRHQCRCRTMNPSRRAGNPWYSTLLSPTSFRCGGTFVAGEHVAAAGGARWRGPAGTAARRDAIRSVLGR